MSVLFDKEIMLNRCSIHAAKTSFMLHDALIEAGAFSKPDAEHMLRLVHACEVRVNELDFHSIHLLKQSICEQGAALGEDPEKLVEHCAKLRDALRKCIEHLNEVAKARMSIE
ncbi:hypothetical protein [Brevifollis gellanilyticus]|uniref:Uncharacterized protein n=1 Tax=Brevifollis gellanilyticus TaxID=748831 RepID=A0A512M2H4_9BACT|nr:hypothetical protein [Brevifollis gellanilyticus]GEP40935.1 hypothetical protein BGE01nite_02260 [Brevifollis gellanilyticus]